MADIRIEQGRLIVALTTVEKLEAVHGDLRVPLSAVGELEVVDQPLALLHGFKLIGAGVPGSTAVGIWEGPEGRTFSVEHHASRGLVINLEGQAYRRLIIGSADPEGLAERVRSATRPPL
ncbi:MAG TPA: hypothetical protein VI138_06550 [Candidatus Dormibacteraeota bacterium]